MPSALATTAASGPAASAAEPLPGPPVLQVRGLTKRYGERVALHGVNLHLQAGCMAALLGPNGAGKSTLFQVLTGLFAADQGDVQIRGLSLHARPARALQHLGVVFQQMSLDLDLSVQRNLMFHARLQGLPTAAAQARMATQLKNFGLAADARRPVRELSGGNRRKVELARALLHQPALLLMDEPTVGLDPKSRRDLLATVRDDVRQRASSVLWATHLVEEAQAADRVLVLHQGRLLADGTPDQVCAALGGGSLEEAFIRATSGAPTPTRNP